MPHFTLEEAGQIHREMLVFDGHNDIPVERVARGEKVFDWWRRNPEYHTDVPRMREGGYGGGIFIVGDGAAADLLVTSERLLGQIDAHPEVFRQVRSSADVEAAHAAGRIAVLPGIEGAGPWLKGELDVVRLLYRVGVRALGITHGEGGTEAGMLQGSPSPFGPCSLAERQAERQRATGLTEFGRQVLQLSNELGLVTDLAHINDRAFYEVLEHSSRPVTMSHTAVCALCPHWRCLTDDQIRGLAAAGGVMGIAFAPFFIHPEHPTVERLVEHVRYAADLVGVEHVAIGTDFDGLGTATPVIADVAQLPGLTQALLNAGFAREEIALIWGGNFVRLLRQTIDV